MRKVVSVNTADAGAVDSALAVARGPLWRRVVRVLASVLGGGLALAGLAAAVVLVVVPQAIGGTTLTVLSGSMVPTFAPGDVIAIRLVAPADACSSVKIGDVLTFLPNPDDPTLITHRVIGKGSAPANWSERGYQGPCTFTTQGDANSATDDTVLPKQVRGTLAYVVPRVGWLRQWAVGHADQLLWPIFAGVVVLCLISWLRPRRKVTTILLPPDPRIAAGETVVELWSAQPQDSTELHSTELHSAELHSAELHSALDRLAAAYAERGSEPVQPNNSKALP